MGTITVGYGTGDYTDSEQFEVEHPTPFDVKVSDRTGVLQVETPGKVHLYAPGFWRYVDVDTSAADDTDADVSVE